MNHTGNLEEGTGICFITGEEVMHCLIDLENSPNATMSHGSGKVQINGVGPRKNLLAKASPLRANLFLLTRELKWVVSSIIQE